MLTSSKLALVEECPGAEVLPKAAHRSRSLNAASARGTMLHRALELRALAQQQEIDVERLLADEFPGNALAIASALSVQMDLRPDTRIYAEQPFSGSVEVPSSRMLERNPDRDKRYAGVPSSEIPGTSDMVLVTPSTRTIEVADLKSGNAAVTTSPRSIQNLWNATMAIEALEIPAGWTCVLTILAIDEESHAIVRGNSYRAAAGDVVAETRPRVRRIAQNTEKARRRRNLDVVPSEDCRYCEAVLNCPAHGEALRWLLLSGTVQREDSPEKLSEAARNYLLADRMLKQLKEALEGVIAAAGPIPVSEKKQLALTESMQRRIEITPALETELRRMYGDVAFELAAPRKVSFSSLDSAVLVAVPGDKKRQAELVAHVTDLLTEAGAITTTPTAALRQVNR